MWLLPVFIANPEYTVWLCAWQRRNVHYRLCNRDQVILWHILLESVSDSTRNFLIIGNINYVENKRAWNGVNFNLHHCPILFIYKVNSVVSTSTEHARKRIRNGTITVSEFGYFLKKWHFLWKKDCFKNKFRKYKKLHLYLISQIFLTLYGFTGVFR